MPTDAETITAFVERVEREHRDTGSLVKSDGCASCCDFHGESRPAPCDALQAARALRAMATEYADSSNAGEGDCSGPRMIRAIAAALKGEGR